MTGKEIIEIEVPGKEWWRSKTIWFNAGATVGGLAVLMWGQEVIPAGAMTLIVCGVNIVLRHLTMLPLAVGGPQILRAEVDREHNVIRLLDC